MKLIYLILTLAVSCHSKFTRGHNGRPACRTLGEVGGKFANFIDFSTFWQCESWNRDAKCYQCPTGQGYNSRLKTCIHWNNWRYLPLEDPPSLSRNNKTVICEPYKPWRYELWNFLFKVNKSFNLNVFEESFYVFLLLCILIVLITYFSFNCEKHWYLRN